MNTWIQICTYVLYMYTYIYVCIYIYIYTYICMHTYHHILSTSIYICSHTNTCTVQFIYMYMYYNIYIFKCKYMYSPINTCTQMFTHISTRVHSTQCDLDKEQRLEALEAQLSHEVAACEQQAENSMHVLGEGICVPVRVFCQIKGVLEGVLETQIKSVLEALTIRHISTLYYTHICI